MQVYSFSKENLIKSWMDKIISVNKEPILKIFLNLVAGRWKYVMITL